MNTGEPDFVSDLNDGGADENVSVHANDVQTIDQPQKGQTPAAKVDKQNTAPTQADSLRDQISSALKGEEATPPAAQQDGQPRQPDGKFATKQDGTGTPAADVTNTSTAIPNGLSAAEAQVFSQLPAELQASLARTMEGLNERATRFAGYEQLEQMIAPRRQAWALNGVTEVQAINQLFALSDFAAQKPAEFIQYFAQQRGVDLEDILYGTEPVDPTIQQLQQQVQDLTGQLTGMTTQQQQAAHNAVVQEITAFATEAGADGKPLRPYFEELGSEILPFIEAVRAQNPNRPRNEILQEAYDRACWGNPSVRGKLQAANAAAEEARRIEVQKAAAARARNAGVSVSSGVPVGTSTDATSGNRSLREEIAANLAAAG